MGVQPPQREGDLSVHNMKVLSFPLLSRRSLAFLLQSKRKDWEGWGGWCGCNSTHIPVMPARAWACTVGRGSIASARPLDSNLEHADVPNQPKSKLLRAHEPGYPPFGVKVIRKRGVGPPEKKLGVTGKKIQVHSTSSNNASKICYKFFNIKKRKHRSWISLCCFISKVHTQ